MWTESVVPCGVTASDVQACVWLQRHLVPKWTPAETFFYIFTTWGSKVQMISSDGTNHTRPVWDLLSQLCESSFGFKQRAVGCQLVPPVHRWGALGRTFCRGCTPRCWWLLAEEAETASHPGLLSAAGGEEGRKCKTSRTTVLKIMRTSRFVLWPFFWKNKEMVGGFIFPS